ncbi:hypothetical protein SAMN05216266_13525 [Amycolatopsis marina]|uniref:Uncharacterized protein n=1 Tax=Amycolatopsis marina TaxID=490629 RepID=A0A1I1CSC5_9PSEU|nr:hypothetical protein [Amycolatopsis marina]SFB63480.1 hypothetical protein SAMN05216266_13525 [Amycolatopsis marina]
MRLGDLFGGRRWIYLAVVVGLVGFAVVVRPWTTVEERARTAAEGLRDSPVHVAAGARDVVDEQHAREVIGDRAIVVALFEDAPLTEYEGATSPPLELCRDLAELTPTNVVLVYAQGFYGEYRSKICVGPAFPDSPLSEWTAHDFNISLVTAVTDSSRYRVTAGNVTPEIEELVLAFDARSAERYGEILTRSQVGDTMSFRPLALAALGTVLTTVALFLLLRRGGQLLGAKGRRDRALARRRKSVDARLNVLADRVLHPHGPPDAQAAGDYVLILHSFGEATTETQLDQVEHRIEALERTFELSSSAG